MAELFAPLLHLPDVLERLAADHHGHAHGHHHDAHGHGHEQARALGVGGGGGGAPVDIVETPGEYAFVLDVPGLSKSDIQVRTHARALLLPLFKLDSLTLGEFR